MAVRRSYRSYKAKPSNLWKLMLRDGLNLYMVSYVIPFSAQILNPSPKAVWLVNMVNMLFWFIIKPTGPDDPIRTIVTRYDYHVLL